MWFLVLVCLQMTFFKMYLLVKMLPSTIKTKHKHDIKVQWMLLYCQTFWSYCIRCKSSWYIFKSTYSIETPSLRYSGAICAQFRYHIYGGNIGQLNVFTSNRGESSSSFSRTAASGNVWLAATVDITISYGEKVRSILLSVRN